MFRNKCKPCTAYSKNQKRCRFDYIITKKRNCPCRNCLVKVTCETICDSFKKLINPNEPTPRFIGGLMI
jgi:hypothetical protein